MEAVRPINPNRRQRRPYSERKDLWKNPLDHRAIKNIEEGSLHCFLS